MNIIFVRHSRPAFAFNIEPWLAARGQVVRRTHFFDGERAPEPEEFDAVVVFGGLMGARDEDREPWLLDELRWIESVMNLGKPLMGVCLGSQLIARVLGARVYRNPEGPEIGFFEAELNDAGSKSPFFQGMQKRFACFEWHYDLFELPGGATLLASDANWKNQAFSYGDRILATQFHLEFTRYYVSSLIDKERENLPSASASLSAMVQSRDDILGNSIAFASIRSSMETVMANFLDLASSRGGR